MGTHTITINDEAYERLKRKKGIKDSFSDVIISMTDKPKLMDFAGIWSDEEADKVKKRIKESRTRSRKRMERIKKRMRE